MFVPTTETEGRKKKVHRFLTFRQLRVRDSHYGALDSDRFVGSLLNDMYDGRPFLPATFTVNTITGESCTMLMFSSFFKQSDTPCSICTVTMPLRCVGSETETKISVSVPASLPKIFCCSSSDQLFLSYHSKSLRR